TIISTEVIEHLYDPRSFIRFCKGILLNNGGGNLIITTPYHGYIKNLALAIFGKWDSHADPLWDGGHIKLWSKKTLTKLLTEEGFAVTDFVGTGRVPYLWKSMIVKAKI
ncbi:MAG: methyltransferase domain-containing protein, partial [Chitinophagaceae bacterium]